MKEIHGVRSILGPKAATEKTLKASWFGVRGGKLFRCQLCAKPIEVGQQFRLAYFNDIAPSLGNAIVCSSCDTPDLRERWLAMAEELKTFCAKFFWLDPAVIARKFGG